MQSSKTCLHDRICCFDAPLPGTIYCANHLKEHIRPLPSGLKQCEYVSGRTHLQCPNIVPVDQLTKDGFCGDHTKYLARLKQDYEKTKRILDPGLKRDGRVEDEPDETLDVDSEWPYTIDSLYCDSRREDDDDDPLKNAGVFTSKEVIKRQIAALEREKKALKDFHLFLGEKLRRLNVRYARHVHQTKKKASRKDSSSKPSRDASRASISEQDSEQIAYTQAQTRALAKYGSHVNWKSVQDLIAKAEAKKKRPYDPKAWIKAEVKLEMSSERIPGGCGHFDVIKIEKVEEKPTIEGDQKAENGTVVEEKRFCTNEKLPFAEFCSSHILEDEKQIVYGRCSEEGCSQICFVFEKSCSQHAKTPLQPRPRRKAILSMDSIATFTSTSDLRPRSYTDISQQPSTSAGHGTLGEPTKSILRRGRANTNQGQPTQSLRMLPFLLKPGVNPSQMVVPTIGGDGRSGFMSVPTTHKTPGPSISTTKPTKKPRRASAAQVGNSSSDEDNGRPTRRVIIDSSEDDEPLSPVIKKQKLDQDKEIVSQSMPPPSLPGRRRYSSTATTSPSKNSVAPNKPHFRNNGPNFGQGKMLPVVGKPNQIQRDAGTNEICARVLPYPGRKPLGKDLTIKSNGNGMDSNYEKILQGSGGEKTGQVFTSSSGIRFTTIPSNSTSRVYTQGGFNSGQPSMINARITYGRARVASTSISGVSGTNLSNVPANAQGPAGQNSDDHGQVIDPGQNPAIDELESMPDFGNEQPQAPSSSTNHNLPHSQAQGHHQSQVSSHQHIPSEHDYTAFRQPQNRTIRQPQAGTTIRRIQYLPIDSLPGQFHARPISSGPSVAYRPRFIANTSNPRARVITIPSGPGSAYGSVRQARLPRPMGVGSGQHVGLNGSHAQNSGNQSSSGQGQAPNGQTGTGAPIYVNGGKQIFLKGIDIGSISNIHTARYAPTNIITKRRIADGSIISTSHPIKHPRKQQFAQNAGTHGPYTRLVDPNQPYSNLNGGSDGIPSENSNDAPTPIQVQILTNSPVKHLHSTHPGTMVETRSPPVGLTAQQITHTIKTTISPTNGLKHVACLQQEFDKTSNSEVSTPDPLEMLACVSTQVSKTRRESTSCGLEEEADD